MSVNVMEGKKKTKNTTVNYLLHFSIDFVSDSWHGNQDRKTLIYTISPLFRNQFHIKSVDQNVT